MENVFTILKRELQGYFETPIAYVFIVIFLLLSGIFTFYMGGFYVAGVANLESFFTWHPWLYVILIPAISMRLWAEERKTGTIELLLTLPFTVYEAVLGKFLAAWLFAGVALFLTFPIWFTVNYLGDPENGIILMSYIGSFLMIGSFLAIGSCVSALTNNQVISFVVGTTACFLFTISGFPAVLDFFMTIGFSQTFIDTVASFSFIANFHEVVQGVLSLKNFVFFVSMIVFWLYLNVLIVQVKRA